MSNKIIGVIGDANLSKDDIKWKTAFEIGKCLIENKYRLANGGMGGVMEASTLGAKSSDKYQDGMTISVIPDYDKNMGNAHADIIIPTGLGLARNVVLASMCDAIIAIGGGSGTLSEIALAWQMNKLIIAIDLEGWSRNLKSIQLDKRRTDKIFNAKNSIEAIEILKENIDSYNKNYKGIKLVRLGEANAKNIISKKFKIQDQIILIGKGSEGYIFRNNKTIYKIFKEDSSNLSKYWKLKALSEKIYNSRLKHLLKFDVYYEDNILILKYSHFKSKSYTGKCEKDLILIAKELKSIGWVYTDFQPKNLRINLETGLPTIIDLGHSFEPYSKLLFRKMCRKMYISSILGNHKNIKPYLTDTNSSEEFLLLKELGYEPELINKNFKSFYSKIMTLDKKDTLNPLILEIIQEQKGIKTLFDYGSGKGDISFDIKKLGIDVTSFDPDVETYEKYKMIFYQGIEFISRETLNFYLEKHKTFDCVLLSLVLCHPLHEEKKNRELIIHKILKEIYSLSSHYVLIVICNPLYSMKLNSSLQTKKISQDFLYFKENIIEKQIKSSNGKRFDYHRPISYYETLFHKYNMKVIQIEQTKGEDLTHPHNFYSDFLIFLLEVNSSEPET